MEKTRDQIDEQYKWKLEDIYASDEEWEKDYEILKSEFKDISKFKNHILDSSNSLYEMLSLDFYLQAKFEKLYYFAKLRWDENITLTDSQKRFFKIENLGNELANQSAYILPELLKADYDLVKSYIDTDNRLKEYEFYLHKIYLEKEHILSTRDEEVLLHFDDIVNHFEKGSDYIRISEVTFADIHDEDGKLVELNPRNYYKYIKSKNRKVREEATYNFAEGYQKLIDSLANNYIGHIKYDEFKAKLRHYKDALDADLEDIYVDKIVYDNLMKTYQNNLNIYHDFLKLRKDVLKVDMLKPWDLAVSITPTADHEYTFLEAKDIILNALKVYGDEYISIANKAFDEHWIDVYSNKGKGTGWYAWGIKDVHPIIFGNFKGKLSDVLSLAHELGHLVQFELLNRNQPAQYFGNTLFEAEVASLTNEFIVSYYLLNNTNDKNEKLEILNNLIDTFTGNFFDATRGAKFEEEAHNCIKDGKVLNSDTLNNIWLDLTIELNGGLVDQSATKSNGWARISHFYTSFYYFKYATGVVMASYIASRIIENNQNDIDKYLDYLKLGKSGFPIDNLASAGVDITNINTFEVAMDFIKDLLEEFKQELNS